jgi:hypothetical protein
MKHFTVIALLLLTSLLAVTAETMDPGFIRSSATSIFQGTVTSLERGPRTDMGILMKATIELYSIEKGPPIATPVTAYYLTGQYCPPPVSLSTNSTSCFAVTTATFPGLTNIFFLRCDDCAHVGISRHLRPDENSH